MQSLLWLGLLMWLSLALVQLLSNRWQAAVVLIVGTLTGQAISFGQVQTGIDAPSLSQGISYLVLPWLIMQATLPLSFGVIKRQMIWLSFVGVGGFVFTLMVVACGLYYWVDHLGFPWQSALVVGTLLAMTDPMAVSALWRDRAKLSLLLESESVFGELLGFVALGVLLSDWQSAFAGSVWWQLLLSLVLGALLVKPLTWLCQCHGSLLLPVGYGVYYLSQAHLGLSAPLVLISLCLGMPKGLWLAGFARGSYWLGLSLVWILGFSLTLEMFSERAPMMAVAALLCWAARLMWLGVCHLSQRLSVRGSPRLTLAEWWQLPVHGPLALAVVLSLPTSLPAWWSIQSVCYGVIVAEILLWRPLLPAKRAIS
ncbi:cation:proton antiporter domain-containing protein [Ferrimonas aestuarii]|uniref:Cation/H+ exchanger transmembrane domain-containing protein n=1 Tax=Ferrimonas aestuarii TaxID=2569539 RepID=A0A4U1BRQ9_9GAMM|nr:cation:proton antiporter [Ferrimonas aestuarii]TKB54529.1 hypothetical protein FCL42_12005 [Ferrimonas aestuarii]